MARTRDVPVLPVEDLLARDAAAFVAHVDQHLAENGRDGVIYSPYDEGALVDDRGGRSQREAAWQRGLETPSGLIGWRRVFVVRDPGLDRAARLARPDLGIVGHLDLKGGHLAAELHRCEVAMGLYAPFRGRGLGRALLAHAVTWAREERGLDWLDLCVFSHNLGALALYRSLGFRETGRVRDRFRVQGMSIEDVQMSLWVGPPDGPPG